VSLLSVLNLIRIMQSGEGREALREVLLLSCFSPEAAALLREQFDYQSFRRSDRTGVEWFALSTREKVSPHL
jgi:hypothetical protein